jgi:hypothetical protein
MTTKAKTKTKFGASMFDSIKAALNKTSDSSGGQFKDIMKFPEGHTYTVRLIPNVEDPSKTFFNHWVHGWTSKSTGKYTSALGLQTFGENDPIANLRWKQFKAWKEANPKAENKEYEAEITQKEQWLVNIYVLDDPADPSNNGTVKILRMGPQLKKIIDEATEGERSDELGYDIFDLSKGYDFKIVAEKKPKTKYTTFESSLFKTKSKYTLDEDEIEAIYEKLHDLEQVYQVKTAEELTELLNEHFFVGDEKDEVRKPLAKAKKQTSEEAEEEDDIDVSPTTEPEPKKPSPKTKKKEAVVESNDEDIDELLAGLDD